MWQSRKNKLIQSTSTLNNENRERHGAASKYRMRNCISNGFMYAAFYPPFLAQNASTRSMCILLCVYVCGLNLADHLNFNNFPP